MLVQVDGHAVGTPDGRSEECAETKEDHALPQLAVLLDQSLVKEVQSAPRAEVADAQSLPQDEVGQLLS